MSGKEEEEEDDYMPHISVDWAPTKVYLEQKGMKATIEAARNFARDTATRHLPIDQPEVIVLEEPPGESDRVKLLFIGLAVGILIGATIIYSTASK